MRECNNCGARVTARFARVFGDNDDQVYGCPSCTEMTVMVNGGVASEMNP